MISYFLYLPFEKKRQMSENAFKFIEENTLLNQYWVMEPKKKVKEIIQDLNMDLVIIDFVRYKIGE